MLRSITKQIFIKNNIKGVLLMLCITLSCSVWAQKTYQRYYDNQARLTSQGWLLDGKKTKYWYFYFPNGQVKKEGHYKDDHPIKYWHFFSEKGLITQEGHYENGYKTGWWIYYNAQGEITHKCQVYKNQKNGYCLMYTNNKLTSAAKYNHDKKIKEWTTFEKFKRDNNLSDLR